MKSKINSTQSGFTLVELIVVIIILAILGAVALPKFMDVTEKAQISAVRGAGGGLGAGVALFHAQWVANGHTGAIDGVAGFGDGTQDANGSGWAIGTDGTLSDTADCLAVWNGVMQGPPKAATAAGADVEYVVSFTTPDCTFTYHGGQTAASNMSIIYETDTGAVVVDSTP